jgi:hypothetical protein
MPLPRLRDRLTRRILFAALVLFPLAVQAQQSAPPTDQIAYVTNRSLQNVNISLSQGGRTRSLGRVNANETRAFRLVVPPAATDAVLTASPTGDRSLKLVSDPLPITGRAVTWEIIQMPSREVARGISTVIQRSPRVE